MKSKIARRILRLNLDFALAQIEGRNIAPFIRRQKQLAAAYLTLSW